MRSSQKRKNMPESSGFYRTALMSCGRGKRIRTSQTGLFWEDFEGVAKKGLHKCKNECIIMQYKKSYEEKSVK